MKYRIKHGDTLSELAVRFNTTTASLASVNNIKDPDKILAGAVIEVPGIGLPGEAAVAGWVNKVKTWLQKGMWYG